MIPYQLLSNGHVIASGNLVETVTPHGHQLSEFKTYFNGAPDYTAPLVVFDNGEKINFELKLTPRGYSGGIVTHGYKYGCNFNRVQNKTSRWGLTVWAEKMNQAAAE